MDNDELNLSEDLNIADALTEAEDELVGYVGGQNQTNQQIQYMDMFLWVLFILL